MHSRPARARDAYPLKDCWLTLHRCVRIWTRKTKNGSAAGERRTAVLTRREVFQQEVTAATIYFNQLFEGLVQVVRLTRHRFLAQRDAWSQPL